MNDMIIPRSKWGLGYSQPINLARTKGRETNNLARMLCTKISKALLLQSKVAMWAYYGWIM